MNDERVTYIQGDAFTYEPDQSVTWMVSDVIAYPDRIVDLLRIWCSQQLASHMIVTMKFQGSKPAWKEIEEAFDVATTFKYCVRAKHFFNNKNEITLMLSHVDAIRSKTPMTPTAIPSFYKAVSPK